MVFIGWACAGGAVGMAGLVGAVCQELGEAA